MIIKKLVLKSFGKFQNTSIDLKEGMNLIVGENESGKSTIHQFIEGMFYGFYKQNIKNKKSTQAYEKYYPWDNTNDFSGVMIIEDEGKEIRIERSFMKNKDSVQIFHNLTGENITGTYPYDPVTKTYQPAMKHLGLNLPSYQNTVSIAQMKSRTGDELINEIKDNIINLGETKRIDVSIANIMKTLAEKKAAIGTERSKKSNYSKTKETIEQMESEKEDTTKIWDEIKQLKLQENNLSLDLQALEKTKQRIERKMTFIKDQEGKESYEKVKLIGDELAELERQLEELSAYAHISKDEINETLIKLNNSDFLKREYDQQYEKVQEMKARLDAIEKEVYDIDSVIIEIGASEKISRDVYKYEEFENSKKYSGQSAEPEKATQLTQALEKKTKANKKFKLFSIITMSITLLLGLIKVVEAIGTQLFAQSKSLASIHETLVQVVAFLKGFSLISIGAGVLMLLLSLFLISNYRKNKAAIKILGIQIQTLQEGEEITLNRIKDIDERQALLVSKHECKDVEALKALRDKTIKEELLYQDNYKRARQLEEDKEALEYRLSVEAEKVRALKQNLDQEEDWIREVMSRLNLWDEVELKNSLEQFDIYKKLETEKQHKLYLLSEITRGKPYLKIDQGVSEEEFLTYDEASPSKETSRGGFELSDGFYSPVVPVIIDESMIATQESYDDLEEELRNIHDSIVHLNKEISIISTGIASKENRIRRPVQIEEELNKSYEELEKMNFKLNTYNLIEEAIEHISRNIQENFAPKLNEKISKIIARATDYKYTDVKVSPDMEITIVDNELNKMVKASDLSAGTLDLMYFALRLSIAEITNHEQNCPVILDDNFVQFDERRLIKMLELLTKIDRQVLLFTCHKREAKVIERIAENVHTVNL